MANSSSPPPPPPPQQQQQQQQQQSLFTRITTPLIFLTYPWQFMFLSLSFLPGTILSLLTTFNLTPLISWRQFQPLWFGRFWAHAGPLVRQGAEENVVPLLAGHISHGQLLPAPAHPPLSGTVLEIGPGSGMWVSLFSGQGQVRRIYGVEPNAAVHGLLQSQIDAAGLRDVYEIVPVGIQDLARSGRVERGSVDCIVTVLCLCSIPDPKANIAELYGYLKPGGRWYVYEHVRCWRSQGWWMRFYQGWFLSTPLDQGFDC
jgi:SAM-dependent methyltransferase